MSEFMYTELSTVKAYNGKLFFAYIESYGAFVACCIELEQ